MGTSETHEEFSVENYNELFLQEASVVHHNILLKCCESTKNYHPGYVNSVHNRIVDALSKIHEEHANNHGINSKFVNVLLSLTDQYRNLHQTQLSKLEQHWKRIRQIIEKHKSIYEEEMTILLDKGNIELPNLHVRHLFLASEALRIFQIAIAEEICRDEPIHIHLNSLWEAILKSYEGFYLEQCTALDRPSDDFKLLMESKPSILILSESGKLSRAGSSFVESAGCNQGCDDDVSSPLSSNDSSPDVVSDVSERGKMDITENVLRAVNEDRTGPDSFLHIINLDEDGSDADFMDDSHSEEKNSDSLVLGKTDLTIDACGESKNVIDEDHQPETVAGTAAATDANCTGPGEIKTTENSNGYLEDMFEICYHVTFSEITVAFAPGNGFISEYNAENIDPLRIKAKVGLLPVKNGSDRWLCGKELEKEQDSCMRTWYLKDCFSKPDYEDHTDVNDKMFVICTDFLLAILMSSLKRSLKGTVSRRTLIAVPSWFTFTQRQQVANAANMAGFEQYQIFNEVSCSAIYTFASSDECQNTEIVLASESSHINTLSLVSLDRTTGWQFLRGVVYEDKRPRNNDPGRFNICKAIARHRPSNTVHSLCKYAGISLSKIRRLPLIICDSNQETSFQTQSDIVANRFQAEVFQGKQNSTIKGLVKLSIQQNQGLSGLSNFKETLPFEILVEEGNLRKCAVINSKFLDAEFTIDLKTQAGNDTLIFSQKNFVQKVPFGKLVKTSDWKKCFNEVYIRFKLDSNGLIKFCNLGYSVELDGCRVIKQVHSEAYNWFPSQLEKMQVNAFKNVVCKNTFCE